MTSLPADVTILDLPVGGPLNGTEYVESTQNGSSVRFPYGVRTKLTANTTFYISPGGKNTNDGLTQSTPFADVQYAYDFLAKNVDGAGFNVTLQLLAGTINLPPGPALSGAIELEKPFTGIGTILLTGDSNNPTSCILNSQAVLGVTDITTSQATQFNFQYFKFANAGSTSAYFYLGAPIVLQEIRNLALDGLGSGNNVVTCFFPGITVFIDNITLANNGAYGCYIQAQDLVEVGFGGGFNHCNNNSFSDAFVHVSGGAKVFCDGGFSGSATGKRFIAEDEGQIDVRPAGGFLNFFPGDVAGTVSTGGKYLFNGGELYNVDGAKSDGMYNYQNATSGFSFTVGDGIGTVLLDPSGTLATGGLTMPSSPVDGQLLEVQSSQTITSLTVSANAGQTLSNAPTTLLAGKMFGARYRAANAKWYFVS